MNIERLAYLVLKQVLIDKDRAGTVVNSLSKHGIELSDMDSREVGDYIKNKGLGTIHDLGRDVSVFATTKADNFVADHDDLTFDEKIRLIYEDLRKLPDRKGSLEMVLHRLGISYNRNDLSEYAKFMTSNGHAKVDASKSGYDIALSQQGVDYLRKPRQEQHIPQTNVTIENYHGSIVAKGTEINQSGATIQTNPTPIPNKNAPTRQIQKWQLVFGILSGIGAALAILKLIGLI